MPAPDRATLYDVENAIEDACKLIWAAYSAVPAYAQRQCDDLPKERVDFQCTLGDNIGGRQYAWRAALKIRIVSRRDSAGRSTHGQIRGVIRDAFRPTPLGDGHPEFTEERLPYHFVNRIGKLGDSQEVNTEDDCDMSDNALDLVISVREGAFPVESAPSFDSVFVSFDSTAFTFDNTNP